MAILTNSGRIVMATACGGITAYPAFGTKTQPTAAAVFYAQ